MYFGRLNRKIIDEEGKIKDYNRLSNEKYKVNKIKTKYNNKDNYFS